MCYSVKLNKKMCGVGIYGSNAVAVKNVPVSIYASAQHVNT
jgi:hypothetical protein